MVGNFKTFFTHFYYENVKIKKAEKGASCMNKIEVIARRILGWKLSGTSKWFDLENNSYILVSDFQPEQNLDHAMIIVKKLEQFMFTYTSNGHSEVSFNDVSGTGNHLAEAITNAAYLLAENSSIDDNWL